MGKLLITDTDDSKFHQIFVIYAGDEMPLAETIN